MSLSWGVVRAVIVLSVLISSVPTSIDAAVHIHRFTFDKPISWADNAVPWGLSSGQQWDIADGGNPGKALRISAAEHKQPSGYEIRTLQINHKPGTAVRISFDVKAVSLPENSSFILRHFDGYCTAGPFISIADEKFKPFPSPLWDSARDGVGSGWKRVQLQTGILKNSVITLAFIVTQPPSKNVQEEATEYVEFLLDNLVVEVTPLDELLDPGFDWHGRNGGSTTNFRFTTNAADSDWCDFADQEDVIYWNGGTIHYTLLQFREGYTHRKVNHPKHNLTHETSAPELGGLSVIGMHRRGAGNHSAVSWGVRQTVSYSALGLRPEEKAKIRVTMKITNDEPGGYDRSRVQLGVDPHGGLVTQNAVWTEEYIAILTREGWVHAEITFDKPEDAKVFTIYFRHRDGVPGGPPDPLDVAEPQTRGTQYGGCAAYADWVMVELIDDNNEVRKGD